MVGKSTSAADCDRLHEIIDRMLGDRTTFFDTYWHKKPFLVRSAASENAISYGVEDFLRDLPLVQAPPYGAVRIRDGRRFDSLHDTPEELRQAVADGGVCAIKMSRLWHRALPPTWEALRALYARLCREVAMVYMTPARSEDVDLFLAGPSSCLGTHFDTTDVFTLQLFGERRWKVEKEFSLDGILDVGRDPSWYPTREIEFPGQTEEVVLRPGDAYYVPAYTVHRVTGVSWSVSLSLGLRAYNEIDVVEHLLERIRLASYLKFPPIAGRPEQLEAAHADAKMELMQRVRSLLRQLDDVTLAYLLAPLRLPPHLDPPRSSSDKDEYPAESEQKEAAH